MSAKSAVNRLDWTRLLSLRLQKDTAASLTAFRKRYDDTKRTLATLQEQRTTVDFSQYRSVLSNQAIVDQAEKLMKEFKPVTMDSTKQKKLLEQVEQRAVEKAKEAEMRMNEELKVLRETLANIEQARPVEDLTVDDVIEARPDLEQVVEQRLQDGKWSVPGYYEKFGKNSAF